MGDTIYLAAGYAVFWIVSFVYIYTLVNRQHTLQKEVELLEQLAQREGNGE
jgi:CcmD family protein